ncbi:MAG: trypsin-like peptidase domain-containing protein [Alphaproteobacteria bacterium]|nr:trypsin-like peptidase domain-containing protein [Alphaproteobacteria bacterium]
MTNIRPRRRIATAVLASGLIWSAPADAAVVDTRVLDSVVSVIVPAESAVAEEPEGSGVAIAPGGLIATSLHVVKRAETVDVRLHDGRLIPATVVGRDPPTDIALLRAEADLPVLPIGPEPTISDGVCAIGNPHGLDLSVSCGVVSAVHRSGVGFNPIEDYIQTDASANPGSSGGALVDLSGRLVGMISGIFTHERDVEIGVNFAISAPLLIRVVEDLAAHGRVRRGKSGWRVKWLSRQQRSTLVGALVSQVSPGGPAARAGVREGDVLVSIAGRKIRKPPDVTAMVALMRPGRAFQVEVVRGGETVEMTMALD